MQPIMEYIPTDIYSHVCMHIIKLYMYMYLHVPISTCTCIYVHIHYCYSIIICTYKIKKGETFDVSNKT